MVVGQTDPLWRVRYAGPERRDQAGAIAVDRTGNVYVTGFSDNAQRDGELEARDYLTVKYDVDGNELWVARYAGLAGSRDEPVN